jgi:hypothetical protein
MPKVNPNSGKQDIMGCKGTKFYFEAAVVHELIHAYFRLKGKHDESETQAALYGNIVNAYIAAQKQKSGKKSSPIKPK